MKVLLTDPTGVIGRKIVPELLAPEFTVRVIVPDLANLPAEIRDQVDIVRGAPDEPETLCRALDGVDALYWSIPECSPRETDISPYYERLAYAAWGALRKVGTPRVVCVSACGNWCGEEAGPTSVRHAMEGILNDSGAAIRHLRSGWLMEHLLPWARSILEEGRLSFPMSGYMQIPMTAATDLADSALKWLVRRDWNGIESVPVYGPEELNWHQAAAILQRVLDRPVHFVESTPNDYIRSLMDHGASSAYARSQVAMFTALIRGDANAEPRTFESTTPTTLASWAQRELLPIAEEAGLALHRTLESLH